MRKKIENNLFGCHKNHKNHKDFRIFSSIKCHRLLSLNIKFHFKLNFQVLKEETIERVEREYSILCMMNELLTWEKETLRNHNFSGHHRSLLPSLLLYFRPFKQILNFLQLSFLSSLYYILWCLSFFDDVCLLKINFHVFRFF